VFSVYVVFWFIVVGCQYQCNQLPGKTHLQNDLLCVMCDVKPYTLIHSHQSVANTRQHSSLLSSVWLHVCVSVCIRLCLFVCVCMSVWSDVTVKPARCCSSISTCLHSMVYSRTVSSLYSSFVQDSSNSFTWEMYAAQSLSTYVALQCLLIFHFLGFTLCCIYGLRTLTFSVLLFGSCNFI